MVLQSFYILKLGANSSHNTKLRLDPDFCHHLQLWRFVCIIGPVLLGISREFGTRLLFARRKHDVLDKPGIGLTVSTRVVLGWSTQSRSAYFTTKRFSRELFKRFAAQDEFD